MKMRVIRFTVLIVLMSTFLAPASVALGSQQRAPSLASITPPSCSPPHCTSTIVHVGGTPTAASYTCTLEVFSAKLDSNHFYGQGFIYCDQQMFSVEETLTAKHCDRFLWGCFWRSKYTMQNTPCTYINSQGTYCPPSSSVSSYVPQGDGGWRVYLDTTVIPYQGSSSSAQAIGDPIDF